MKIYSATKFSIVIIPPNFSEKTKSKLLVCSFRHIYKVAGLGITTGLSGLFSLSQFSQYKQIPSNKISGRIVSSKYSAKSAESIGMDESAESLAASVPITAEPESQMQFEKSLEPQEFTQENLDVVENVINSDITDLGTDLFIPFVIVTVILRGLTACYLIKYLKKLN